MDDSAVNRENLEKVIENIRHVPNVSEKDDLINTIVQQQQTENIGSIEKPIILDRNQIRALVKAGVLQKAPSLPVDVGIWCDERVVPGTQIPIDFSTYAVHPDSEKEFEEVIKSKNFSRRQLSRQEIRKIKREIDGVINRAREFQKQSPHRLHGTDSRLSKN